MDTLTELPPLSTDERIALTRLLDEFLSTGQTRNLIPMSEVQNLALDLRLILNPSGRSATLQSFPTADLKT